jgi:CHAD domain-containing protein
MPYRLLASDPTLEAALRRIAGEQIDGALRSLEATGEARAEAVHDVRKRCKKVRALLRLVRPGFAGYAQENAVLRDTARLLGAARDAKVLGDTFDAVVADYPDTLDGAALGALRAALAPVGTDRRDYADLDALFAEARTHLLALRHRVQEWSLEADGWQALGRGLADVYGRARKARKRAVRKPSGETHHAWRKRVKDHWYHARLLRRIWPEQMTHRAAFANELAELLGDHHDCDVLEEALAAQLAVHVDPDAVETLIALTRRRRALLEERAHRLGKRLQVDKPHTLAARWGEWWHACQSEGDLHEAALQR